MQVFFHHYLIRIYLYTSYIYIYLYFKGNILLQSMFYVSKD